MDAEIEKLAEYLVNKLEHTPAPTRILIGIAGIPASGKSTLALRLTARTNELLGRRGASTIAEGQIVTTAPPLAQAQAILVGLDGWHLTRAQLDAFADPMTAHARRGAHWTFDGAGYVAFVRQLREAPTATAIAAPSFDHALKDPSPGAVAVHAHHRIVIIEGLYAFLGIDPWRTGGTLLDERWLVAVGAAEARARLVKRHVHTGVARDWEEAEWRAENNDGPNGEFILANTLPPTRVIQSVNIPAPAAADTGDGDAIAIASTVTVPI